MNELLNKLKLKYNYNDDLLDFLRILIPTMIEYFGTEYKNNIISSFLQTPIIISKKSIGDEVGDDDTSLLFAGGAYCYEIIVENKKPKISGKVVIPSSTIKPFNFKNLKDVGRLVHELCHMVKCGLTINYDKNIIINHVGLVQTTGIITNNEFLEQTSNDARGLEEALNAIDETMIMQKIYSNYKLTSEYRILASYIWQMINENPKFLN